MRGASDLPATTQVCAACAVTMASVPAVMQPSSVGRQARWGGVDPGSTGSAWPTRRARFPGRGLTNMAGRRGGGGGRAACRRSVAEKAGGGQQRLW
jgi:hypothetical protein